jgi:hypothetical protein
LYGAFVWRAGPLNSQKRRFLAQTDMFKSQMARTFKLDVVPGLVLPSHEV